MINKYPYTDFHELNLDWILREIMKLHHDYDEFKALNTITNAGAWDITKQYQAWTVVSDNNAGYISLKPVPAGIAITNIEYWGLIADYNILITNLSNRISVLESQMATLNNTTIPAIDDEIDMIKNHNYLVCGDSYMAQDNTPGDYDYTSWKAPHFMQQTLGVPDSQFHLFAVAGTAFYDNTFLSQIQQSAALALADEITDIVVVGGLNDCAQSESAVTAGMTTFINYAKANYPKCKRIYLGFAGSALDNSADLAGRTFSTRMKTRFIYEQDGAGMGYIILNNLVESWDCGVAWFYSGDHLHPSFNSVGDSTRCGATLLGNAIGECIQGSHGCTRYPYNNITIGNDTCKYTFDENNFYLTAAGANDQYMQINVNVASFGSFSLTQSTVYFNKKVTIPVRAIVAYASGYSANVFDLLIEFNGYDITIRNLTRDSGGSFVTLTDVTSVYLPSVLSVPREFTA